MIRTSNRKNAGSRRNKRYAKKNGPDRHVGLYKDQLDSMFQDNEHLIRTDPEIKLSFHMGDLSYRSKPNHESRFASITDCFPLAAVFNIRQWKGDEALRRANGAHGKHNVKVDEARP